MQLFRRDQAQHAITEKLKTFVGSVRICAGMGECPSQQIAV
jgi:hypothetical protein